MFILSFTTQQGIERIRPVLSVVSYQHARTKYQPQTTSIEQFSRFVI